MGFLSWLTNRSSAASSKGAGRTLAELAGRLKTTEKQLLEVPISYQEFQIPKRSKGIRRILAPVAPLKIIQRQILRRILGPFRPHDCATGFCRGHSIVSNALPH